MNHFAKIAEKLSAYELDGMLLTCEANRFYASGFHSTGTDGVALVTREGNFYFTDSRYIEAAHNKVQDAEIAMTDAAHPYVDLINAAMEKTHVQKLGFEDAYMTVADYRHYSEKLHCQLVPATELLISLRQSKDEEEIQRMIAAQRIAEAALDQIVKEIKPGVTEKEIAARLQYLMLAGGAENMSFDPIVASGPNGSMPHAVPTDRKIQDGDFVTMDFGCIYQGYCSDMTRTVAVGRVTEEMEKVYNVVLQAQLAGIAAAKAGATGHDVDAAARKVIEDAGYGPYFGHSFGHSVGVEIHESPNATPANNKPLPLGAAVSAEPGIYLPGRFGVRIEDVVVLQEGGCWRASPPPRPAPPATTWTPPPGRSSRTPVTVPISATASATAWAWKFTSPPTPPPPTTSPCPWVRPCPPSPASICPAASASASRTWWCCRRAAARISPWPRRTC